MAFVHGKNVGILIDEYDLTSYFNQANMGKQAQAIDVTMFGNDDRDKLAGIQEGSLSLSGAYDASANAVDPVLNTALGVSQVATVAWPGYDTIGNGAAMYRGLETRYQIRASVNDAVRITANGTASGGVRFGSIIQPLTQVSSDSNSASSDNGASSANGAVAHLHVTQFSGTSIDIKVTDDADDVWPGTDLITFSSVTGVTSERGTVTGTVERYVRVEWSGTFTTCTFAVSFVRNLQ